MKIAFQGLEGSFSELAAIKLADEQGITEYELIPLATSENVCHELEQGLVDYGVVAIENSIGGKVLETESALSNRDFAYVSRVAIPISQCLFKLSQEISDDQIEFVASHVQALSQCKNTIKHLFPKAKNTVVEDTALAARRLKDGLFKPNTAVICSMRAGKLHGLSLMKENVQDKSGNTTYFSLVTRKSNENGNLQAKRDKVVYWFSKGIGLKIVVQITIIVAILISYYLTSYLGWSPLRSASAIGGPVAAFCVFLTSRGFRVWIDSRRVCGYWSYYTKPGEARTHMVDQLEGLKRLVVIDIDHLEIHLKGWLCSSPVKDLFESRTTLITPAGRKSGALMYRYTSSDQAPDGIDFNGMVCLEFYESSGWKKVNRMAGWYINRQGDMGSLEFIRIEKEECNRWLDV